MFRKIWIGNDHGGVEAKHKIVAYLRERDYEVVDIGTGTEEIVRYPYYAARVAQAVSTGAADAGILICSTGIGMSVVANKFRGVRASVCTSHYMGTMTRRHNDSNVLCLGGRITGIFEIMHILEAWLCSEYEGGRHDISLGMLAEGEEHWCGATDYLPENNI